MDINNLRILKWKCIDDWSSISKSNFDKEGVSYISKNDILNFIIDYTHKLARQYNLEYKLLKNLLDTENEAFYGVLNDIFKQFCGLGTNSVHMKTVKNLFKIPAFETIEDDDPVNDIVLKFNTLNDLQKADLLSKLNIFSIKVIDKNVRELR